MTQEYRIPSHEPFHAPPLGPFTADRIKDGDRYELSEGHRIYCAPAGERHAQHNVTGASLLDSDPDVEWSGVDAGFSPNANTMCAPDVSVAPPPPRKKGWISGVPPLAVEYADQGQNEADLEKKIKELLAAGTRYIWVVRLTGPQRVEVHAKGVRMRRYSGGDTLAAPGILRNPVPVRALFDRRSAHRATLRNLLQREGYEDLASVLRAGARKGKAEGKIEGKIEGKVEALAEALFRVLAARGFDVDAETRARIDNCRNPEQLGVWLTKATIADKPEDIF
uniref:Endonuclease, Uma2 family (Restriction endonuclease fold) n=1 Tax=Candidatus Kentrum sp. UNK TaxID=2126344 RepID=A0A451AGB0_9GAMM|nr:MAG: Endonuclease, Uma2 family (restriction endonuclease fold) [Candidatus Kentron sp. UNK]VFK69663.1 MAG: Endonuclease, Uma2 family (restriction endonuclease fold) [Candidatus Kentron sp. UNK]